MSTLKITQHYEEHFKRLVKKFTFKTGTQWAAEDVVQEAYLNALKYVSSFRPDGDFKKWFNAILNNCFYEYRNKENGMPTPDYEEEELVEPSRGLTEDVRTLIKKQSKEHQEILNLHFFLDYSARDISMVTNNSYSNCHKVIERFRNEIKKGYND